MNQRNVFSAMHPSAIHHHNHPHNLNMNIMKIK